MLGVPAGGYCIRLSMTAVRPDAAHRDTIGQILLLAAGLVVLTVISAGSVHLVNRAREDARWVVHSIEIENQLSFTQLQLRRAESAQRGFLSTFRSDFQTDFEDAASELTPALMRLSQLVSDNPVQKRLLDEMLPSSLSGSRNSARPSNLRERSASTKPPGSSAKASDAMP